MRVYYLEESIFWAHLEGIICKGETVTCGFDGEKQMYYINEH